MPYRVTERTQARRAATRERILRAAHELVAGGGFGAASVAAVAARAGVATGSVYRHFSSKADLFAEVFRRAAQREVDAVADAGTLAGGVETFARRALAGRRLAWALLAEAVEREGGGWARERASAVGRSWGRHEVQEWGRLANENTPVLRTHDRYGNRIDEVEFHPSYHQLMALSSEHELHSLPWTTDQPG